MKAKMVDVQELVSDDLELLLREIDEFCAASTKGLDQDIPESLENYLTYVAKTGNTIFPWPNIRPLFRLKLKSAIAQFQGEPSNIEPYVFERFDLFRSAPFTIQRLSELITSPNRHYKIKDKFVSALEKTVFVVSTVEPKLPQDNDNFTNGSEENNTSSSEDGIHHEMNITFDSSHHSDYNHAIGIELPSMSLINSDNETLKMDADSMGDGDVVLSGENLDPAASGDNGNGESGQAPENNGFTPISESTALIQEDPMSFQAVQHSEYNHAEDGELNAHVSSLMNVESTEAVSATLEPVAPTATTDTGVSVAVATSMPNSFSEQPQPESVLEQAEPAPAPSTEEQTQVLTATEAADDSNVNPALETPASVSVSVSVPEAEAAAEPTPAVPAVDQTAAAAPVESTSSSDGGESVTQTQLEAVFESIDSTS